MTLDWRIINDLTYNFFVLLCRGVLMRNLTCQKAFVQVSASSWLHCRGNHTDAEIIADWELLVPQRERSQTRYAAQYMATHCSMYTISPEHTISDDTTFPQIYCKLIFSLFDMSCVHDPWLKKKIQIKMFQYIWNRNRTGETVFFLSHCAFVVSRKNVVSGSVWMLSMFTCLNKLGLVISLSI